MAITRSKQARQMYKKGSEPVVQGGVENYLGRQPEVQAPRKWQSGPDKPATELAYITEAEKDLLLKADIHGSLKEGPNEGPAGIMSLDSFGDIGGGGSAGVDTSPSGAPSGDPSTQFSGQGPNESRQDFSQRVQLEQRKLEDAKKAQEERFRSARVREEIKANRKRIKERFREDKLRRQAKIEGILKGAKSFIDPVTQQVIALNELGLTDTELKDLGAISNITGIGPKTELQKSIIDNLLEKSDKFSGANIKTFQDRFETPETGLLSLDAALNILSGPLKFGSKKTRTFFTEPTKNIFGKTRKSVLAAGKLKYKGQTVTPEAFAAMTPAMQEEIYGSYMADRMAGRTDAYGNLAPGFMRDAQGNIISTGNDGRDPILPIIPQKASAAAPLAPAIARNLGGLSPRIGGSIFDFTGLADGGRVGAMDGGIMDIVREEMFLGGVVKGIKKGLKGATRAIKKVAKSPLGKAAILGAIGFGAKGFLGKGAIKNFLFKGGEIGLKNLTPKGVASLIGGASLLAGAMTPKEEDEFDVEAYYAANRLNPNPDLFPRILGSQFTQTAADGGRIGYADGTIEAGAMMSEKEMKKLAKSPLYKGFKKMYGIDPSMAKDNPAYDEKFKAFEELFKKGFQEGGDVEPVAKKTMPLLDMGGQEMDLRDNGGFVPIGRMEKADDVPARLSKNEFVFTAEAVRNAGDGDVDKGAEVMYNMMKNLEDGGNVSEESQGLEGARRMFQTSKRLEEVL
jgi:hypothetical protein